MPAPTLIRPGEADRIAAALAADLETRAGRPPLAVAAAPGRVNLIGEHLDYNAGRCLPTALPHATYAAVAGRGDRLLTVTSLQTGETRTVDLDALEPGGVPGWPAYVAGVVWALEQEGWALPGLDVVVDSRVPIGAGLSSSAALECSVALALLPVAGVDDSPGVRRTLRDACVRAEGEMAGAPTGGMDQSIALEARAGQALLLDFADATSEQVPWSPGEAGVEVLVVDTRVSHELNDGGYAARRADCEKAARLLGVSTLREVEGRPEVLGELGDDRVRRRARHVLGELDRVGAFVSALRGGDHAALGPLLDASHASLRDDFEVSCAELDLAVEVCREHGSLGARMTGAGFGGSAVALVPAAVLEDVTTAVTAAFARAGYREPGYLLAPPAAGARLLR